MPRDIDSSTPAEQINRFDHWCVGIASEARKAIGCDDAWAEGDCFDNLSEMNDHDPCARCHLAWRIACFEDEATSWWHELGVIDGKLGFANAERHELRAALRGLVRGMAEVAPAQREAIRVLAVVAGREEEAKADA